MYQIQNDSVERQQLVERILADMRATRPEHGYKASMMRVLFCKQPAPSGALEQNDDVGRFLRQGYCLTFEDLYRADVLPKDNPKLKESVFKEEFEVPQLGIEDLGDLEKGRTDVYFLGQTYSGHSCMLAGVIKYLHDKGRGVYVPHRNREGKDVCVPCCNAFIRGLDECKLPQSTCRDTMSFLQFNLGESFDHKVTFVEYGDGALARMSSAVSDNPEVWNHESLCLCLKNDNPKTLFFVLSYEIISNINPSYSEPYQAEILENALLAMCYNGEGKDRTKNCTMSKVKTVAIVFSFSDLMDKVAGRKLSKIERRKVAMDYLNNRLRSFMNQLHDVSQKYGINKDNEYNPYIYSFGLGSFYVGNSVVYDPSDSECLAEFLINSTKPKQKFGFLE